MCIAAWIWQAHPKYPLLLVLNRDEYHDRPTDPLGWWGEEEEGILGGRDVSGGGTWLGCTKEGRVAFLTNVLEPDSPSLPSKKTRGDLPLGFLQSRKNPLEFALDIVKEADKYGGFNLVIADLRSKTMVYVSNRPAGAPITVQLVSPGGHVLSNARLDTPWHKSLRLAKNFVELLENHDDEEIDPKEMADTLMADTLQAHRDKLPKTGCDPEWELQLSSIFVQVDTKLGRYGTRSTSVVSVKNEGEVNFYEKYLECGVWKDHSFQYQIEKANNAMIIM